MIGREGGAQADISAGRSRPETQHNTLDSALSLTRLETVNLIKLDQTGEETAPVASRQLADMGKGLAG